MTNRPYGDPSIDLLYALWLFKVKHGQGWQSKLRYRWLHGTETSEELGAELRELRNGWGPAWLTKFRFENIAPAKAAKLACPHIADADGLICRKVPAWPSVGEMILMEHGSGYRPTCHLDLDPDLSLVADLFDAAMKEIGDPRRAYVVTGS